ncbi:pro-sigmaK processing inhibitor BofA family protein [Halobacteria archaeon AArc-m2/3/4]|uniref:Pro-sigmaK processing inhibitor BofA family protein n=1 Tax=Natronoglomus mannanivorans TaxID=2979990 RepID=A0AAP3E1K0_9EURY|nr:pro-sigmaK processing inhibitor BofA family protein [Halobacteria archaeon AArc-xg1-1]MCU4972419.1 pro-sigmaK processing inhibitor BofA family protein [Halobacteria archaeon AArc-m2/3/4]
MVTGLEIALLLVVLAFFIGAARIIWAVRPFIVNAVVGLVVLWVAQSFFGLSVAVTPIALLVVAIGGVPGAVLVILLAVFELAFVA